MAKVDVKVPDIGDFKDVPVIEVLVKPGDVVKAEQSLITLESDKATMDVPSPVAGTVAEVVAKVGDKVSMGTLIARVESGGGRDRPKPLPPRPPRPRADRSGEDQQPHPQRRPLRRPPKAGVAGAREGRDDRHHDPRHRRLQGRAGHRDSGEGGRHGRGGAADRDARIRQGEHGRAVAGGRQDHGDCRQGRRQGVDGLAGREARRRRIRLRRLSSDQDDEADAKEEEDAAEAPDTSPVAPTRFAAPAAKGGVGPRAP